MGTSASGPGSWRRRVALGGLTAGGLVVAAASVAWACTVHVGTLKVCAPAGTTNCSKAVDYDASITGNGAQVSQGGGTIKVSASNIRREPFSIYFQAPEQVGNGALCSEVGTKLGANAKGPKFSVNRTTPPTNSTGQAKVCIREADGGPTGNGVVVMVI